MKGNSHQIAGRKDKVVWRVIISYEASLISERKILTRGEKICIRVFLHCELINTDFINSFRILTRNIQESERNMDERERENNTEER